MGWPGTEANEKVNRRKKCADDRPWLDFGLLGTRSKMAGEVMDFARIIKAALVILSAARRWVMALGDVAVVFVVMMRHQTVHLRKEQADHTDQEHDSSPHNVQAKLTRF